MAPRTRATAASAPAPAPLAAAPRRRVKVTSLEKEKPTTDEPKQTVRATRSTKTEVDDKKVTKSTAKTTAAKTKGRPKKTDTVTDEVEEEEEPVERLAEKPKRATRSTRATANTASSVAKAKPATRATKATKISTKIEATEEPESQPELAPVSKPVTRKKVTFQDHSEDDKENQPLTRATKKTAASKTVKASDKVTGLRAKPVRNPAITSTRATKRSKPYDDDELVGEEKPKKIQRILTPKKITQVAKAKIQDEEEEDESEDELNGGKTPIRDLSLSPRRPQSSVTMEAIVKQLSPAKKLDLSQPLLHMSAKKTRDLESGPLMSPARRLPISPAKLFSQSTVLSTKKSTTDSSHGITSPARRPLDSPAKLLFPHATKNDQRVQLSQSSNLLFQSPKRSTLIDPAQMFAQSAVKPQKTSLSKSNFFSSPAKRVCIFSPQKQATIREDDREDTPSIETSSEIGLDDMEVTELIKHGSVEINVSSHQRQSFSPVRPYRLTQDDLQMDFDDSILPVRSPLKIAKSPAKVLSRTPKLVVEPKISDFIDDEEVTAGFSSLQNTPHQTLSNSSDFVNLHSIQKPLQQPEHDVDMTESEDEGDDTIVMPQEAEALTPRVATNMRMVVDDSVDDVESSPQVDIVAEYLQTPKTPATVYDHEMSNLLSSPSACGTPAAPTMPDETEASLQDSAQSVRSLRSTVEEEQICSPVQEFNPSSPLILHENELTVAGVLVETEAMDVCLNEGELTMMGGTPKQNISTVHQAVREEPSPAALEEHELTVMASAFTPRSTQPVFEETDAAQGSADGELASSPVILLEDELTRMGGSLLKADGSKEHGNTPISRPQVFSATPDLPIPKKFSLHTVVSKVPLKPEGEESPFRFQLKKRKRPVSLGGQPSQINFTTSTTPPKTLRTAETDDAASRRSSVVTTPALYISRTTPASKVSTGKSSRRTVSTPLTRNMPTPSKESAVLRGVIVFVDVRTSEGADASAIYIDLLSSLGAKVVKEWKDDVTHLVYKDGSTKILEKARLADTKIVGVSWPLDCEAQQSWVNEAGYMVALNPVDHLLGSAARSGRRKSMEPSLLVTDGSGSVKRSRSKARASTARRSTIKSLNFDQTEDSASPAGEVSTPKVDPSKQQAALEKNSLTAAWKSINATSNLGEDTPARRTLELLQKSYDMENNWDDTMVSEENENENDENTPQPSTKRDRMDDNEDVEDSVIDTGLTPAPFRTKQQIGSAPSKLHNAGLSSYRERVEEMERREMRNNAFGTNKGERGLVKGQKDQGKARGKRMTMFGFENITN